MNAIAGLILAAGESSRIGRDKALLCYRGRTFIENLITTLQEASIGRIVVVLGYHAEEIGQRISGANAELVVNQDYRRGQTSSLQAGLRVLREHEPDGVVMCLVDHPAISADTVRQLIYHFKSSGKLVVIPEFHGQHGHPVVVGQELFGKFLALSPDEGADTVIHRYRDQTRFVEVSDPGVSLDVDDPEAYRQLTVRGG